MARLTLTRRSLLAALAAAPVLRLAPLGRPVALHPAFRFAIAGGWYHGLGAFVRAGLTPGQRLALRREPENPHDPWAIAVLDTQGKRIGYVPRSANRAIAEAMDAGRAAHAEIVGVVDDKASEGLRHSGFMAGDPLMEMRVEAA